MVVRLCHRITYRDIARAAKSGCTDYEALQEELLVGTSCGHCDDCARSVFAECSCAGNTAAVGGELAFA